MQCTKKPWQTYVQARQDQSALSVTLDGESYVKNISVLADRPITIRTKANLNKKHQQQTKKLSNVRQVANNVPSLLQTEQVKRVAVVCRIAKEKKSQSQKCKMIQKKIKEKIWA